MTRALSALVVALLALAALVLAADRLAERMVEGRLRSELARAGFAAPVDVEMGGWPALTQLARGELRRLDVRAPSYVLTAAPGGALPVGAPRVELTAVRRDGGTVRAGTARLRAVVPFAEVARRTGRPGLELAAADAGLLRVSVTGEVLGRRVPVDGVAEVAVGGPAEVVVRPRSARVAGVEVGTTGLPASVRDTLVLRLPLRGLPQGLELRSVAVVPEGFRVDLDGSEVVLPATGG